VCASFFFSCQFRRCGSFELLWHQDWKISHVSALLNWKCTMAVELTFEGFWDYILKISHKTLSPPSRSLPEGVCRQKEPCISSKEPHYLSTEPIFCPKSSMVRPKSLVFRPKSPIFCHARTGCSRSQASAFFLSPSLSLHTYTYTHTHTQSLTALPLHCRLSIRWWPTQTQM